MDVAADSSVPVADAAEFVAGVSEDLGGRYD